MSLIKYAANESGIATITLDRDEKRNAINQEMAEQILRRLEQAEADATMSSQRSSLKSPLARSRNESSSARRSPSPAPSISSTSSHGRRLSTTSSRRRSPNETMRF